MRSKRLLCLLAIISCVPGGIASSHAQQLDSGFHGDGWLTEGFQSVHSSTFDVAVAACADSQGRLLVAGVASGGVRVVSMRLLENGSLDTSFSTDGKESFELVESVTSVGSASMPAVCMPDGRPVFAYEHARVSGQREVVVLRVGLNGLPDAGFGEQGRSRLQFLQGSLVEEPTALALSTEGLELGATVLADRSRAAVARLDHQGLLRAKAVLGASSLETITALGLFANGSRMVVAGSTRLDASPYGRRDAAAMGVGGAPLMLAHVDAQTLGLVGAERIVDDPGIAQVGRGRLLPDGRLAVALGRLHGVDVRPALAFVQTGTLGTQIVGFDRPLSLGSSSLSVSTRPMELEVVPLPDGRTALVSGLRGEEFWSPTVALFLGVERAGMVDASFGVGGGWVWAAGAQACKGAGGAHLSFRRSTLWNGRLTWVGSARVAPCSGNLFEYDYWVARMRALSESPMFADGFE